jgi:hypothetical protein
LSDEFNPLVDEKSLDSPSNDSTESCRVKNNPLSSVLAGTDTEWTLSLSDEDNEISPNVYSKGNVVRRVFSAIIDIGKDFQDDLI